MTNKSDLVRNGPRAILSSFLGAKLTAGKAYLQIIDLAKLQFERTDFIKAIPLYVEAASLAIEASDTLSYIECQNNLLRMYVEMAEFKKIEKIKDELTRLFVDQKIEITPKTYYCLALCASYKGDQEQSLQYLERSLAQALAEDSKKDICYAISGLVATYISLGRLDEALKEIYNLQIFFQVLEIPEVEFAAQILNGVILRQKGRLNEALEVFWQAYDKIKESKNLYMYISLLYHIGITYSELNDKNMARIYLGLVTKLIDPKSLKRKAKRVNEALQKLGVDNEEKYDLQFNVTEGVLREKNIGDVQIKNQFVLVDLLKLFLGNPGEVFSKEELVKKVWKQSYDPRVHDNKIYVTIKRLRKIVEPDINKPKYIFRAKNGYYLNKTARVYLQ